MKRSPHKHQYNAISFFQWQTIPITHIDLVAFQLKIMMSLISMIVKSNKHHTGNDEAKVSCIFLSVNDVLLYFTFTVSVLSILVIVWRDTTPKFSSPDRDAWIVNCSSVNEWEHAATVVYGFHLAHSYWKVKGLIDRDQRAKYNALV